MNRRHFISHMAASSLLPFIGGGIATHADQLKKERKSAILLWMSGGPSTMDIWDLKPDSPNSGPFRPIDTTANGVKICEHLPLLATQMHNLSIIRSMSTREADHARGRYYMHTGYPPIETADYPSYGSVVSHELINNDLEIPPFVSIGGASVGAGFLGANYAPFVVDYNGNVRNLEVKAEPRTFQRLAALKLIEDQFIKDNRGSLASEHKKILGRVEKLITSKQMQVFNLTQEPEKVKSRYGNTAFGRGCLMARRLVELGVPFIEVDLGGWDNHSNIFPTLKDNKLPDMDKAMSALVQDLETRGLLNNTAIIWMGEFSRTPRINPTAGRDHWARSWSVVVGGAGFSRGIISGETDENGIHVKTEPYAAQDLMATTLKALGISLNTTFTSNSGRPMKIANGGKLIKDIV